MSLQPLSGCPSTMRVDWWESQCRLGGHMPSAPLLLFLQEQRPPGLSPAAGDGERAPSSRYCRATEPSRPLHSLNLGPLFSPDLPASFSGRRSPQGRSGGARTPCSCGRSGSGGSSSVECGGPPGRTGVGIGWASAGWWAPKGVETNSPELPALQPGPADPTSPSLQFSEAGAPGCRWRGCGRIHSGHLQVCVLPPPPA